MFASLRSLFALGSLGVVLATSGCAYEEEVGDGSVSEDELVRVALTGESIKVTVEKEPLANKSYAFTKDFGSGSNTFTATAIVTANADFNLSGDLKVVPTWNASHTQLEQLNASMKGAWDITGGVDVSMKLTGAAAKNKSFVASKAVDIKHMLSEQRVLKSWSLKALKLGFAEVVPTIELVLDCDAGASAEFDVHAEAGIKGAVDYSLNWNRTQPQGKVTMCSTSGKPKPVDHHWKFTSNTPKPTIVPPAISVTKADGSAYVKCALKPRLALDLSLGIKDSFEAALSAAVDGGLYVSADVQADALQRTWTGNASVGMQLNANAQLKLVVFCKDIDLAGSGFSRALIGNSADGVELAKKSYSGNFL